MYFFNILKFEKILLTPLKFSYFYRYSLMFKSSHLGILKFDFLSLCPFRTKNPNEISILPQNYASFSEWCSVGVKGKIEIAKKFLYKKGKVREKQSLIHLSESF